MVETAFPRTLHYLCSMKYTVYVIYSESIDQFFRGYCKTKELDAVLERHASGKDLLTAPGRPWRLIWKTEKEKEGRSKKLCKVMKRLTRPRLLDFMLKYSEDLLPEETDFVTGKNVF